MVIFQYLYHDSQSGQPSAVSALDGGTFSHVCNSSIFDSEDVSGWPVFSCKHKLNIFLTEVKNSLLKIHKVFPLSFPGGWTPIIHLYLACHLSSLQTWEVPPTDLSVAGSQATLRPPPPPLLCSCLQAVHIEDLRGRKLAKSEREERKLKSSDPPG